MILEQHTYKPEFKIHQSGGLFPYDLLFGFECEFAIWRIKSKATEQIINNIIDKSKNFLYIKRDGSIKVGREGEGAEINSHPFNWNYLLKHKKHLETLSSLDSIYGDGSDSFLNSTAKQFRVNRTCGFHVHISKDYFTDSHLENMVRFFYNNSEFIEELSQRGDNPILQEYSKTKLPDGESVQDFINNSTTISGMKYRYAALNLSERSTVEIRIFQGTLNPKLMLAYLEFALAITLFTKYSKKSKLTVGNFVKNVNENTKYYKNLIELLDNKLKWK